MTDLIVSADSLRDVEKAILECADVISAKIHYAQGKDTYGAFVVVKSTWCGDDMKRLKSAMRSAGAKNITGRFTDRINREYLSIHFGMKNN